MSSPLETRTATTLPFEAPRRAAGIVGLGSALPPDAVTSDAIAERLGVPRGWIERRTGIRGRRRAAADASVVELATEAGADALASAGVAPSDVDLVLVATMSQDEVTPNAAPQVAHALGTDHAGALDVGAACTGFVGALSLGAAAIEAGRADTVLVAGAEIMSRHVDHDDRSTAGLFGDGAGAVVLGVGESGFVGAGVLGSDGAAAPYIRAPRDTGLIRMDGHETFKRAVASLVAATQDALAANGLAAEEVDLFVLHQANGRILSAVAEALSLPGERVLDAIAEVGNTSAASLPLALAEARGRGLLRPGDRVLLGAVGAGFTWGATVVTWGTA
jgi:3-oxoacyl-[acyl-carrier-protein] synthase III